MKNQRLKFMCKQCNYESAQWFGRCPTCGVWNSFVEEKIQVVAKKNPALKQLAKFSSEIFELKDIPVGEFLKYKTSIKEFDNMIGGGIVSGSLVLLGGPPGIGKSTLMLQISKALSNSGIVLYVSGEESISQIKLRAVRLNVSESNIFLTSETNLQDIINAVNKIGAKFLVVDSVQTTYHPEISSAPGTIVQIKETATELLKIAKLKNIIVFLLGHVTKEGDLAGPKVLEHIVDTVLYFEDERQHKYRILRAHKNRFGPTNEIGVFEMNSFGLSEVLNPSLIFLGERTANSEGGIITVAMEGTRPLLLEVQALVTKSAFSMPRRMVSGYSLNHIIILIAVLEKRLGLSVEKQDIFVNVVGGVKIKENSADLAVACAIFSSILGFVYPRDTVVFGEVGLAGEIRSVPVAVSRLFEAEKLGFKKAIIPQKNLENLSYKGGINIFGVETLEETNKIFQMLFKKTQNPA
jgi:DNA repair protein RadA/Sms